MASVPVAVACKCGLCVFRATVEVVRSWSTQPYVSQPGTQMPVALPGIAPLQIGSPKAPPQTHGFAGPAQYLPFYNMPLGLMSSPVKQPQPMPSVLGTANVPRISGCCSCCGCPAAAMPPAANQQTRAQFSPPAAAAPEQTVLHKVQVSPPSAPQVTSAQHAGTPNLSVSPQAVVNTALSAASTMACMSPAGSPSSTTIPAPFCNGVSGNMVDTAGSGIPRQAHHIIYQQVGSPGRPGHASIAVAPFAGGNGSNLSQQAPSQPAAPYACCPSTYFDAAAPPAWPVSPGPAVGGQGHVGVPLMPYHPWHVVMS